MANTTALFAHFEFSSVYLGFSAYKPPIASMIAQKKWIHVWKALTFLREIMLFIGKPKGRSMMISNATNPLKESRKNLY